MTSISVVVVVIFRFGRFEREYDKTEGGADINDADATEDDDEDGAAEVDDEPEFGVEEDAAVEEVQKDKKFRTEFSSK